jgi:AraC-like DNA-binding protein
MTSTLPIKDKSDAGRSFKIAPFKKEIKKTTPHKHNNYFEIIFLSKGNGIHTIDARQFPVRPPLIYIVRMEQVHHWDLQDEPAGYVLLLKKAFIDNSLDKELKNLLVGVSAYNCLYFTEQEIIEHLFDMLAKEYLPEGNNNTPVIEGLLKVLFAKILQIARPLQPPTLKKANLFEQFQELLSEDKTIKNNVAHYAALLHTTPQNLNAHCRKAAAQPAREVLASFIISEAKRLLIYTNMTVLEISQSLDFKDNSHFIKYFKRYTDHTPQAFRSII